MAEMTTLLAEPRSAVGKGANRALRRTGRVPGVIYGEGQPQQLVSLEARALRRELQNARFQSSLLGVALEGAQLRVLPREIQLDKVTDEPIHIDFVRVSAGATVHVEVAVHFLNEEASPGLKRGGVLNIVRREVELVCPADSIPEFITLDLAGADIGASLHISHVPLPEGVRPAITDRDFTIATIAAPSGGADEAEGAEGEAGAEGTAAG